MFKALIVFLQLGVELCQHDWLNLYLVFLFLVLVFLVPLSKFELLGKLNLLTVPLHLLFVLLNFHLVSLEFSLHLDLLVITILV
jgi:hypothetical protein